MDTQIISIGPDVFGDALRFLARAFLCLSIYVGLTEMWRDYYIEKVQEKKHWISDDDEMIVTFPYWMPIVGVIIYFAFIY